MHYRDTSVIILFMYLHANLRLKIEKLRLVSLNGGTLLLLTVVSMDNINAKVSFFSATKCLTFQLIRSFLCRALSLHYSHMTKQLCPLQFKLKITHSIACMPFTHKVN